MGDTARTVRSNQRPAVDERADINAGTGQRLERAAVGQARTVEEQRLRCQHPALIVYVSAAKVQTAVGQDAACIDQVGRSEEHTSELQSLMRISYAVFFLKKKNYYILYFISFFISYLLFLLLIYFFFYYFYYLFYHFVYYFTLFLLFYICLYIFSHLIQFLSCYFIFCYYNLFFLFY